MFDNTDLRSLPTDRVESELVETAGHIAAGTCRFLLLLAEFDLRQGWAGPGLRSCAHWLGWRVGLSRRTARDHLRVAHALRRLPATTEAFAAGRISYSKVRALTRIATPATEQSLLVIALHGTAHHVEKVVRATRAAIDTRTPHTRRGLHHDSNEDGSITIRLRLPADRAHQVLAAVEAALDPPAVADEPLSARRADALHGLVTAATTTETTLVVHVSAEPAPRASIENGPPVSAGAAARLTCTAGAQALVIDRRGNPLYLGRRRRTVTAPLLRALRVRDRESCVVPGCHATRHLEAHHVRWWRFGGGTDLNNLALVCGFHHTLVHEHGYRLTAGPDGVSFARPEARVCRRRASPPTATPTP